MSFRLDVVLIEPTASYTAMVQVAEALAKGGVELVPDVIAGSGGGSGTLVDVLLANVIRESTARSAART